MGGNTTETTHHNTAESVGFNTHLLESDVLSVRSSASADQDNIGLESLVAATSGSFQRKSDSVAIHLGVNHLPKPNHNMYHITS